MIDTDGAAQGEGWTLGAAIMGADDEADETNGRTNEWWLLDGNCQHRDDWGFYVCPTYNHRTVVSLFLVNGLHDSLPSTMQNRGARTQSEAPCTISGTAPGRSSLAW